MEVWCCQVKHKDCSSAKFVVCTISLFINKYMQRRASEKAVLSAVMTATSFTMSNSVICGTPQQSYLLAYNACLMGFFHAEATCQNDCL